MGVLKMLLLRVGSITNIYLDEGVLTMSSSSEDVLIKIKIFALVIHLQDIVKTFSRHFQEVYKPSCQTPSRHLQYVIVVGNEGSWDRLEPKTNIQKQQYSKNCEFWFFVLGLSLSQDSLHLRLLRTLKKYFLHFTILFKLCFKNFEHLFLIF